MLRTDQVHHFRGDQERLERTGEARWQKFDLSQPAFLLQSHRFEEHEKSPASFQQGGHWCSMPNGGDCENSPRIHNEPTMSRKWEDLKGRGILKATYSSLQIRG